MTTNNGLNQASEIFVVGPIGTAADGTVLLTVRKDQNANSAVTVKNANDNSSAQAFFQIKQQMHNGGSPALASAGLGFINDQSAIPYSGYIMLANNIDGGTQPGKGVAIVGNQDTDQIAVAIGATNLQQALWKHTGGNYRGDNTDTVPSASYIGEIITSSNTTGTSLTSGSTVECTHVTLSVGKWLLYGKVAYLTTGTVSGNTDFEVNFSATTASGATLSGDSFHLDFVSIGGTGVGPISGVSATDLFLGPYQVYPSGSTSYYLNAFGSGTVSFTNVKVYGTLTAVRFA